MGKITASIGAELYKKEIQSETNSIVSDEPKRSLIEITNELGTYSETDGEV